MNYARSISRPVRVVPLECPGRVQHRNRLQPPLGARELAHRTALRRRAGRACFLHLCGAAGRCQPTVERARRSGRAARRPGGVGAAAASGDRDRAYRDLPARCGGDAFVTAVRAGGARVSVAGQRRRCRDHRCRRAARGSSGTGAVPGTAPPDHRRRALQRRAGVERNPVGRRRSLRLRDDAGERSGSSDLYQRYDRSAQGSADAALGADRQSARLRRVAELVPAGGRRVLVARGLGLDRRADGRAAAHALLRIPDRRHPRPLRPRTRLRSGCSAMA